MKIKLVYAIIAMSTATGMVVFQVGRAGDKHVTVVKENTSLRKENSSLKQENQQLKQENQALDSLSGGAFDSLTQAAFQAVSSAIDSTQKSNRKVYETQINNLKDELQQVKDDLYDLDRTGRRIPLGPIK